MRREDEQQSEVDFPADLEQYTFDEWRDLHDTDPQRFDLCRLKMLNDYIDSLPESSHARLRGLIFQMEGELRRSKSRLGHTLRLSSMMMELLDEMRQQLVRLCGTEIETLEQKLRQPPGADIIPFSERAKSRERD